MLIRSLRSLIGPPVCSGRAAGRTSDARRHRHAHRRAAWPPTAAATLALPRHDIVAERTDDGTTFVQVLGPFSEYERTRASRRPDGPELVETTRYRLRDPVVRVAVRPAGALDAAPVAADDPVTGRPGATPWWAPPDRLTPRNVLVLGLLAAASMSSAFINTLFTQTV